MDAEAPEVPSTSTGLIQSEDSKWDVNAGLQLTGLPETVIHRVFSYLNHPELLQAQRVNKQFCRVIRRISHLLCRPKVMEMGISMCSYEKRVRPFGRLQTSSLLKASKRRRLLVKFTRKTSSALKYREYFQDEDYTTDRNELSESLLNYLDQRFKEVEVHGILSFSGIAINTDLYNRLCKNWVKIGSVTHLMFTLCRLRLSSEYFCELLMRTRCQGLSIELSHFEQFLLDDLVVEAMPECQELILSSVVPMYFAGLTDRTLHRWVIQEKLPRKILLRNIRANFTFDGVITLINALQIRHPELFSSMIQSTASGDCREKIIYEWDFGCIPLPEQNQNSSIVELLSTPGVMTHVARSCTIANVIDVTINSKDFYLSSTNCHLSVKLQLLIASQKVV